MKRENEIESTVNGLDNRCDNVMNRDKDHLFGELVDYDQDSIKLRE